MAKANAIVSVCLTPDEKATLLAEAAAEGVSVSTLIWQRTFRTTATRRRGRNGGVNVPAGDPTIPGLKMTG